MIKKPTFVAATVRCRSWKTGVFLLTFSGAIRLLAGVIYVLGFLRTSAGWNEAPHKLGIGWNEVPYKLGIEWNEVPHKLGIRWNKAPYKLGIGWNEVPRKLGIE